MVNANNLGEMRMRRKKSSVRETNEEASIRLREISNAQFPIAIVAACCDMATIAESPFVSLSQFVQFCLTQFRDPKMSSIAEAHLIIFQRYCLAYKDQDQLLFQVGNILIVFLLSDYDVFSVLFQTLVIIHLKIMEDVLVANDFADFRALAGLNNLIPTPDVQEEESGNGEDGSSVKLPATFIECPDW